MNEYITIDATAFIHKTATIYPGVTIGPGAYIGPGCIIGGPAEHLGTWGMEGMGVDIGAGAVLTGLVTVDSGTTRKTVVGPGCFLMKGAHLGHDVILEHDVVVSCGAKIGGHCYIMNTANLGLNAVIHQWKVVGSAAMIGMGAVVTKRLDVEPFMCYAGNPAKCLGRNNKFAVGDVATDLENSELSRWQDLNRTNRTLTNQITNDADI